MDSSKKRQRKPRGRGLRTKTGCLTCRKRHKKCDEAQPICGPCSISSRPCVFPGSSSEGDTSSASLLDTTLDRSSLHHPPSPLAATGSPLQAQPTVTQNQQDGLGQTPNPSGDNVALANGGALNFSCTPETVSSELWTTDFATTRWLGLLATDAAQADSGFSLAPTPVPDETTGEAIHNNPRESTQGAPPAQDYESLEWQSGVDATLTSNEAILLRHFSEHSAQWLDVLDPQRSFSTYAIRLALRNTGLMKAILALSAKHRAQKTYSAEYVAAAGNEWIGYYYETLHYLQEALSYNTYTHSEELLATAIVISAYEMLDETDGRRNWQRHLKGVFWIQRSQDVNGGSGGLRQSVWWAWLRQDIWAAFREKRQCLSFWEPVKAYDELTQHELANQAIFFLSQAINLSCESTRNSRANQDTPDLSRSMKRRYSREEILADMACWKSHLGSPFKPLPSSRSEAEVFTPLWIHPPEFGVALQAYSFAQILIALHSPIPSGFNGYLKMQRTLSEAVDTICGIAMELKDEGCQIFSAQCLYGAGLCVQEAKKRETILHLIEAAEARVGWAPMATWRDDLCQEWAKADGEGSIYP